MNFDLPEAQIRSGVYELLALAFCYPTAGRLELLQGGSQQLREACLNMKWHALADALGMVEQELSPLNDEQLGREYISIFGHTISTDCPPYETEYHQSHVFQKSQTLADLGIFYGAFGVGPSPDLKERLDHVSIEMEFMNLLTLKETYAHSHHHGEEKILLCREAQQRFLANHLAHWIGSFGRRLGERAGNTGVYAALGKVLDLHLAAEFDRFGLDAGPINPEDVTARIEEELDCAACPLADDMPLEMPQKLPQKLKVL